MSDDEDEELCNAAGEGEETELQGMLQAGRSADATDCGVPAIQWAVGTDMLGTMRILLAAGADTEKRDTLGHTALTMAARCGKVKLVPELLSHGADPSAKGAEGLTAAEWAEMEGHSDVLAMLSNPPPSKTTQAAAAGGGGGA